MKAFSYPLILLFLRFGMKSLTCCLTDLHLESFYISPTIWVLKSSLKIERDIKVDAYITVLGFGEVGIVKWRRKNEERLKHALDFSNNFEIFYNDIQFCLQLLVIWESLVLIFIVTQFWVLCDSNTKYIAAAVSSIFLTPTEVLIGKCSGKCVHPEFMYMIQWDIMICRCKCLQVDRQLSQLSLFFILMQIVMLLQTHEYLKRLSLVLRHIKTISCVTDWPYKTSHNDISFHHAFQCF
jgi:hypothetical protein